MINTGKVFGSKDTFAVECLIDTISDEKIPFGYVCLWIEDNQVGDFNEFIHLLAGPYLTLKEIYEILQEEKSNTNPGYFKIDLLEGKSKTDVFQMIDNKELSSERIYRIQKFPDGSRSFDPVEMLFLDQESHLRIIWRSKEFFGTEIFESMISKETFCSVIKSYTNYLEDLTNP